MNEMRPDGSNADEWHLFLAQHLDNRANSHHGLTFMAVQIAEAVDFAFERGRQVGDAIGWAKAKKDSAAILADFANVSK
jgi:hypothetical protein